MRPISNPYDHPFPKTGGMHPQSKLASQIAAKRCQIITDSSLWEHTSALPNSTIVDCLRVPLPRKRGSQKIKFKTAAKSLTIVTEIYTTCGNSLTPPMLTHMGTPIPPNLGE